MAKQEPQQPEPLTAADLRAYVESQDDFAFEREVFHKARGYGLTADHAGLYLDPVTGKPRQFDIRASQTLGDCRICLTIECKALSAAYPLLVSCVPRARSEGFHELLYTDKAMGAGGSFTRVSRRQGARSLYPGGQPVGKAMRQVRKDGRGELVGGDEVFDKWMQALASAADMVAESADQLQVPTSGQPRAVAILPVLVVSDETLWVADYSPEGGLNREPFTVPDIDFFLGRKYELPREQTTFTISHLEIYTRGTVHSLFEQITRGGGLWQELFDV
jgi:hypothetical protein